MKPIDPDRWPVGRPAAPNSPFFWHGADTPAYVAGLESYERRRRAATKGEQTKRKAGRSTSAIYGLSRGSDERLRAQKASSAK